MEGAHPKLNVFALKSFKVKTRKKENFSHVSKALL
jgi:hypothetical protein